MGIHELKITKRLYAVYNIGDIRLMALDESLARVDFFEK